MSRFVLPGWEIEPVFSQVITIEKLNIDAYGVIGRHSLYGEAYGSSADIGIGIGVDKAWYEFLERACTLERIYPDKLEQEASKCRNSGLFCDQYEGAVLSKSNGVAIHKTIEEAQYAAALELIERHSILESWCGNAPPPKRVERNLTYGPEISKTYNHSIYSFASMNHDSIGSIDVAMVVLTPLRKESPFCYGFGAGGDLDQAITKAESEALQRLAFLWEEDIPQTSPTNIEASASFHQEFYLCPENWTHFEAWLKGHFMVVDRSLIPPSRLSHIEFANITTPSASELGYYVVKAISDELQPLFFGKPPQTAPWSNIQAEQTIHPIA
ncbi:YcaO-like family protein [Pseudobacteriovorax antillogorgiicola]|uniref:YcaO-like family protein n=1 Tax=Pseudobacteriovorax antillogorgiicola TaxID=1513793 RepID=A0A1Y6CKL0_9BACT|nr:YcaO-like family protein [Pseudobacteriovorax antillogorgiicola]TCS45685.1 YcaO-like family protein [Pseudobacteriovorax antillogorgiicola]SMF73214.1 YcaO-like family protein [Pseudobacteriovorax antillogorgiicola]